MHRPFRTLGFLLLIGCSSCAGRQQKLDHRGSVELYSSQGELASVRHTASTGGSFDDRAVRNRTGLRFAFGHQQLQGFMTVFQEDWNYPGFSTYPMSGVEVGARGIQPVGDFDDTTITLVLPWGFSAGFAVGAGRDLGLIHDLLYRELHAEAGVGMQWKGLRASLGAAFSSIDGEGTYDLPIGGVSSLSLSAGNAGLFFDVRYSVPSFPVNLGLRAMAGDYSTVALGLSFRI